jgi:hypothetical protein
MGSRHTIALCVGAVLGPIAGLVMAPLAIFGAACALMSLVLASAHLHPDDKQRAEITTSSDDAA